MSQAQALQEPLVSHPTPDPSTPAWFPAKPPKALQCEDSGGCCMCSDIEKLATDIEAALSPAVVLDVLFACCVLCAWVLGVLLPSASASVSAFVSATDPPHNPSTSCATQAVALVTCAVIPVPYVFVLRALARVGTNTNTETDTNTNLKTNSGRVAAALTVVHRLAVGSLVACAVVLCAVVSLLAHVAVGVGFAEISIFDARHCRP